MNLNKYLNPNHTELFSNTDEQLLIYGGAGAGKSYSICDKLLLNQLWQSDKDIRIVVIRKTFPSLRTTTLEILKGRAKLFGMPFNLNKAEWTATCNNLTFNFMSLNNKEDFEKLKSLTDVDYIWFNELPELREDDYEEALRRLRGGQANYEQLISDFNPIGTHTWVYKRFFEKNIGDVKKLKYTVMDNHPTFLNSPKGQRYVQRLKAVKEHNYNLYKVYFLGEWGELKGVIFDWDIVSLPEKDEDWYDEIIYGGDFGYSVDPAAFIKIYRKANEYWLQEVIYETGLTNRQLGKRIKQSGANPNDISYWDCAEPKSIDELCEENINAYPCIKGPDSIKAGIDYLKEQKIHIVEGSENIVREKNGYVWKENKDGLALNVPVDINNHAMDAVRYGIYTHAKQGGLGLYTGAEHAHNIGV